MPTKLPNGLVVYNLTKHDIPFEDEKTGQVVVVPSDGVLNAEIQSDIVEKHSTHFLAYNNFYPNSEGKYLIAGIRKECPEAIIVGSMVAAQAYPEDVVAQIPTTSSRQSPNRPYTARCNRFTTFKRSNKHHG